MVSVELGSYTLDITPQFVLGAIFVIAALVIIFMNFVGVFEGIAGIFLLLVGLYLMGVLK